MVFDQIYYVLHQLVHAVRGEVVIDVQIKVILIALESYTLPPSHAIVARIVK